MFLKYKTVQITLLLVAALMGSQEILPAAEHQSHEHQSAQAKYYCPMHPQVTSDKPGECPICHMRLVPIQSASDSGSLTDHAVEGRLPVKINKTAQQSVGIVIETVEKRPLQKTIEAWGMVAHDPELYQLQVEFLREERLNYERQRDRTIIARKRALTGREKIGLKFLEMGLSEEWVDALNEAEVPDKRLIYHDADGAWVYVELREKDAPLVKPGDTVILTASSLPGLQMEGEIKFIDNLVNEENRTVRIRVLVQNLPTAFKPNTLISATIKANLGDVLTISEDAPLFTGSKAIVFVNENNDFKPRTVLLGERAAGFYEVKEGLMEGEKVAKDGNFFIDSESRLRASFEGVTHVGHGSHAS